MGTWHTLQFTKRLAEYGGGSSSGTTTSGTPALDSPKNRKFSILMP